MDDNFDEQLKEPEDQQLYHERYKTDKPDRDIRYSQHGRTLKFNRRYQEYVVILNDQQP